MKNTAFNIKTLNNHYGLNTYRIDDAEFAIALNEDDAYEAAREYLKEYLLIDNEEDLYKEAIELDGFGHFLASNDGEELEVSQQLWYDALKDHISEECGSEISIIDALAFRID